MGGEGGGSAEPADLSAMTEEEQIAYAMRMSMQDSAGGSTPQEEKMDVDEQGKKKEDDYEEALNDPAVLQSVLESLPGVDPQSEAVRQVVRTMTTGTDNKDKGKGGDEKSKKTKTKS